ncbi:MAG: hypothetical protein CMH54_09430 [Myxococcales bacterium]|nr:hypothetical protein [Myxococcales bacterium]|tara:strand:+ start:197 stop:745 length:549 start_codon:yes stop_codon:yes gene_type:complete
MLQEVEERKRLVWTARGLLSLVVFLFLLSGCFTPLKKKLNFDTGTPPEDIVDTTETDIGEVSGSDIVDTGTPEFCADQDDGTPCDDEDPCTQNDSCLEGICQGQTIPRESMTCDEVDNDCDGFTDEDCTIQFRGGLFGDGHKMGFNVDGITLIQTLGTPRFIGSSDNALYRLKPGVPKGEKP